jgi:gamma-glutamyltranspeptidase/glutathione hydrolase
MARVKPPIDIAAPRLADPFASVPRPVLAGVRGAVAAAHPLAVAAGQEMLQAGGSAVDAAIAAQAVLAVVAPDACGLGGDALALVRLPEGRTVAVNGAGASPMGFNTQASGAGATVTVPGIVDAWDQMAERWSRLPFATVLGPATRLARAGIPIAPRLARAVADQKSRLVSGGARDWAIVTGGEGAVVDQLQLASLLDRIAKERASAFYSGRVAEAIAAAAQHAGGALDAADLAAHRTVFTDPVTTTWRGMTVATQPPMAQGILLSMALDGLERLGPLSADTLEHAAVEVTEAAFGWRSHVGEGAALLEKPLAVDLTRAAGRGGPRAYLHTAGVATADRFGMCVSSLVSVFDDFGSGVFVPEGGFVLNNRAAGFTTAPNDAAPGKRPVHTLAPIMVEAPGGPLALATPGADGQVQTLLQVLLAAFVAGEDLASAVARPRWRSEDGRLLVEAGHPWAARLAALGHRVETLDLGHMKFGAVVAAGHLGGAPVALADFRRETWAGVT